VEWWAVTRTETVFTVSDRTATLTLNRPETRNAMTSRTMLTEIVEALTEVRGRPDVSVLILTGAGGAFSSGGNVKDMRDRTGIFDGSPGEMAETYRATIQEIPKLITSLDLATIASIPGPAIGAGLDLALMCDVRIASTAARFGHTFANLGIIPGDGGAWFLPRAVGWQRASELAFTGRIIDAEEALEIGLVLEVVEPDELESRVSELATRIASQPPHSIRLAKRLLRHARDTDLDAFLDMSAAFQAIAQHTEDHREAVEAFFEKRPGRFRGQ
jgi:enoyl-CoA hydratase/carnithine racemase